jgi:Na+-driven multidrug efflux pump
MIRDKINGRRLVGLFLLGMLLFNFPLLYLFNRPVLALGIPVLYLYLFAAWSLIIFLMLMVSRSRSDTPVPDQSE